MSESKPQPEREEPLRAVELDKAYQFLPPVAHTAYDDNVDQLKKLREASEYEARLAGQYWANRDNPVMVDLRRKIVERIDALGRGNRDAVRAGTASTLNLAATITAQCELEDILRYIDSRVDNYTRIEAESAAAQARLANAEDRF